jgi:hypothetical protein
MWDVRKFVRKNSLWKNFFCTKAARTTSRIRILWTWQLCYWVRLCVRTLFPSFRFHLVWGGPPDFFGPPQMTGNPGYATVLQICKQVVTRLLLSRYQDVFALLVPSCCDKSGTSCYHLVTRLMTLTDLLQVVPTRLKADFQLAASASI